MSITTDFNDVPIDEGTQILGQKVLEHDGIAVLHQKWCWDGITAESIIFKARDVVDYDDKELEQRVNTFCQVESDSSITISKKNSDFIFVNFNFQA